MSFRPIGLCQLYATEQPCGYNAINSMKGTNKHESPNLELLSLAVMATQTLEREGSLPLNFEGHVLWYFIHFKL